MRFRRFKRFKGFKGWWWRLRRKFYKKGGAASVISTKALRSGEIPSDGTGGITLGDLSTQSFIKAFSICPIPTCISARDDGVGERPSRHFDRSEAEWRNPSDGTGSITLGDLSTQSFIEAVPL